MDEPFEVDGIKILYPAELGGKDYKVPESMIWNCRCTLLAWVKGFEGETVKSSPKMGDMSFEEWQNDKAPKTKEESEDAKENKKRLPNKDDSGKVDSEPLPKSLEHFKEYEEEWRKTSYPLWSHSQKDFIKQQLQEVFDNGEYHMAIKPEKLEQVLNSGRFKNQLETGSSGGVLTEEGRKTICKNLFGADVDNMQPRDFEKYGYLGHKDFVLDAKESTAREMYGSVIVRFDKKALNNRITYTHNDSYGGALAGTQIAGYDGGNVSISGFEAFERVQREVLNTFMVASKETLQNPNGLAHSLGGAYFELQYHGDLAITDVTSVCFTEIVPESIVKKLKEFGIRTYRITRGNTLDEI